MAVRLHHGRTTAGKRATSDRSLLVPGLRARSASSWRRRSPRTRCGGCMLGMSRSSSRSTAQCPATRCSTIGTTTATCRSGVLAVLLQPSWSPAIVSSALSLLLFPDGDLPPDGGGSDRCVRRRLPSSGSSARTALQSTQSRRIGSISTATGNLLLEDHPTGAWCLVDALAQNVFFSHAAVIGLSWLVARIPAYRRATGVRRAQLKWVLAGR